MAGLFNAGIYVRLSLEDVKNGLINLILVKDLLRFGRNYIEVGQYTEEFKTQIAKRCEAGKPISAIVKEYGIAKSTISKWHHEYTGSGSLKACDSVSKEEKELKLL